VSGDILIALPPREAVAWVVSGMCGGGLTLHCRNPRSVKFGHKLKTRREIEATLGYPSGPAPGGLLPVPSFVADNKRIGKGVVFGHRLKSRREIELKLGTQRVTTFADTCHW